MRVFTESGIELVFKHNDQRYVIEYDLTIDGADCYTDVTRIEGASITPGAFAHGMALVDADANMRHAEHVADKYADDLDYMTDRYDYLQDE